MIKEAYVSFEVAKLLKEKGFDEIIFEFYTSENKVLYSRCKNGFTTSELDNYLCKYYPHITHQMAMRWLREVHNIVISICNGNHKKDNRDRTTPDYVYFFFTITDSYAYYDENIQCTDEFNTYEEAVEAAIKYCLENLI